MSLNKCMIIGNLGKDPELKYTKSGNAVAQVSVATNRNYRNPNGEWESETEWFRVVLWGDQAERCAEYMRKGNKIYVEGRMQTRSWEGQDGQKRYTTELIANRFQSLERKDSEGGSGHTPDEPAGYQGSTPTTDANDYDDLPF